MSTIAENKSIKRQKILDAAYNLFAINTVAATAIDDVVKSAGVAKGTFYLYFKDKRDLLEHIMINKGVIIIQKGLEALDLKNQNIEMGFVDRVMFMVEFISDFLYQHKELATILDKHFSFFLKSALASENNEFYDIAERFINAFLNEGYAEKEAKMTIYLLTDMTGSICCDAVSGAGPFSYEEIFPILKSSVKKILEANSIN